MRGGLVRKGASLQETPMPDGPSGEVLRSPDQAA